MSYIPADIKKTQVLEYDIDGNLLYQGQAQPGSAKNEAVWKITKYIYNVDNRLTDILWADGNLKEDKIWDNRINYNYS